MVVLWAGQSGKALTAGSGPGAEGVAAIITRRPCESQLLPWLARSFVSVSHSFHILKWGWQKKLVKLSIKGGKRNM